MTRYNEVKDCHIALATGDDSGAGSGLTAWQNAQAAYIAGELKPVDQLLGWSNRPPIKTTQSHGPMTTSKVKGRNSVARQLGEWKSIHAFQTVQFCYWLMQTAGTPTTEGTPAGYNTYTLTIGSQNTPHWHGIHFEREGISLNELRYDIMGVCPSDLVINASPNMEGQKVTQEITIPYSFINYSAADIAAQTKRPDQSTGSLWKTWDHLVTGNGAGKNPSGLTYNGNPLEVDVINVSLKLHRDTFIGGIPDSNGWYTVGLMLGWDYSVVLDVVPTGDLLYTLNKTDKESYAGDLDYDFYFNADNTNDKDRFVYDKMYLVPFDEDNDWNKYFEGYSITLEPLDETSSLTITGIGNLDNTHFENP
jgi:hypothetical protein